MKRAKIVCTLGPASRTEEVLTRMIDAGLDVVRLNFSHGTYAEHLETIRVVRAVSDKLGRPAAIMQDLQGPKIRVGVLKDVLHLTNGEEIVLASGQEAEAGVIPTTYVGLARDLSATDRLLLDDGRIELRVSKVAGGKVYATVIVGGDLSSHKGINLPSVRVSASTLTEKDLEDLRFGVENCVDYVAMSFVRGPADIGLVKREVRNWGGEIPVIAKLERSEAVDALDEILEVADGVMVARGDLGVEMAPEQVPVIQKRIIARANAAGVFVITATQMLESMTENPRPTRAEASDVANAIYDGTDAVMLSGETAVGKYPVETVEMMSRIISEAETGVRASEEPIRRHSGTGSFPDAIGHAATMAAYDVGARAIVAFTQSGATARLISKRRPNTPIVAFTPDARVSRQLSLCWGTETRMIEQAEDTDDMIREVELRLLEEGRVSVGENLVILSGAPVTARAETNLLKLHRVG